MKPLEQLKQIWNQAIKPLFVTERRETLFGIRYNKMLKVLDGWGPAEKNRLAFFMAAKEEPAKDYLEYIKLIQKFCDLCLNGPEALSKGLDMGKIVQMKTAIDLLQNAVQQSDKPYLDRVRREMPVPRNDEMTSRVRRTEIKMLQEDILQSRDRQPD